MTKAEITASVIAFIIFALMLWPVKGDNNYPGSKP